MLKYNQADLITSLQKQGLKFSLFTFKSEGAFLPTDVDWNYKDVPHLNVVHELVDASYAYIGDEALATINLQKILGIRFPLTVFNYATGPNRQTYFTNFFAYQLIIETTCEQTGPLKTCVSTTYAIGSAPLWQVFVPFLKWVLRRNYENLMSTDIPMRLRRGELRAKGYSFKGDRTPYSFRNTLKITESNLIFPQTPSPAEFKVSLDDIAAKGSFLLGDADHFGLRLDLVESQILVFPRTCPHEGANLDNSKCANQKLSCPWHARKFSPIAQISLAANQPKQFAGNLRIDVVAGEVSIRHLSPAPSFLNRSAAAPEATL